MNATNSVAEGIEAQGCRTFSAKEMAFNILGLMHPLVFDVAQIEPVWADVSYFRLHLPLFLRLLIARYTLDVAQRRNGQAS
jgi:3-oxoacyl-ACP reductase-like protein